MSLPTSSTQPQPKVNLPKAPATTEEAETNYCRGMINYHESVKQNAVVKRKIAYQKMKRNQALMDEMEPEWTRVKQEWTEIQDEWIKSKMKYQELKNMAYSLKHMGFVPNKNMVRPPQNGLKKKPPVITLLPSSSWSSPTTTTTTTPKKKKRTVLVHSPKRNFMTAFEPTRPTNSGITPITASVKRPKVKTDVVGLKKSALEGRRIWTEKELKDLAVAAKDVDRKLGMQKYFKTIYENFGIDQNRKMRAVRTKARSMGFKPDSEATDQHQQAENSLTDSEPEKN